MGSPTIGRIVPGYDVPVVDERSVRAAAGLLFLGGAIAWGMALYAGTTRPLQPFGMFFLIDMLLRVLVGERWSPTMALGALIVRRQRPEWVGAEQKRFAWWLGAGLAFVSCAAMGLLGAPLGITLALCSACLAILFLETAFGICVGCALQARFGRTAPRYCPGDSCVAPRSSSDSRNAAANVRSARPRRTTCTSKSHS